MVKKEYTTTQPNTPESDATDQMAMNVNTVPRAQAACTYCDRPAQHSRGNWRLCSHCYSRLGGGAR